MAICVVEEHGGPTLRQETGREAGDSRGGRDGGDAGHRPNSLISQAKACDKPDGHKSGDLPENG